MENATARFTPDPPDRPRCSMCDTPVDDGSAALDFLCKDCFLEEIRIEIYDKVSEIGNTLNKSPYELYHDSGMFEAVNSMIRRAKK